MKQISRVYRTVFSLKRKKKKEKKTQMEFLVQDRKHLGKDGNPNNFKLLLVRNTGRNRYWEILVIEAGTYTYIHRSFEKFSLLLYKIIWREQQKKRSKLNDYYWNFISLLKFIPLHSTSRVLRVIHFNSAGV